MTKPLTIPEPSLDEIRKYELALRMAGIFTSLEAVDGILRVAKARRKMKDKFDLRTAAGIITAVEHRWKDGTPEVVWECAGFRGFK